MDSYATTALTLFQKKEKLLPFSLKNISNVADLLFTNLEYSKKWHVRGRHYSYFNILADISISVINKTNSNENHNDHAKVII